MVPQQWLVNTTAPGIAPDDRKRLDLVIYGAAPALTRDRAVARIGTLQLTEKVREKKSCLK